MNDKEEFLRKIEVKTDPKTALLRAEIIEFLSGKTNLKEILDRNRRENNGLIVDGKSFRRKIEKLIDDGDKEIEELYLRYKQKTKRGVNYEYYVLLMLLEDYSQREISLKHNINRNTLKQFLENIPEDSPLKPLIKKHASNHKDGRNCGSTSWNEEEKQIINSLLKEAIKMKTEKKQDEGNQDKDN